jgi:hypothetical protein
VGRLINAAKARVKQYVEDKKEEAIKSKWHDEALKKEARREAATAYDEAFVKEKKRQARAHGAKAAQGGGGVGGALGKFAAGYGSGVLGVGGKGGGVEIRAPAFEGIAGLGTTRKRKQSIDDLLI